MSPHAHGSASREAFDRRLEALDRRFVAAASLVAEVAERIGDTAPPAVRGLVEDVQDAFAQVAVACEELEQEGFVLIARQAPVGGDLRLLIGLLHVTVDVERAAAGLRHVLQGMARLEAVALAPDHSTLLRRLSGRSALVFRLGLEAWRSRDALAVTEVDGTDEEVDRLSHRVLAEASLLDEGVAAVVLGQLARHHERVADHGVALAREVAFVVTGERVALPSLAP